MIITEIETKPFKDFPEEARNNKFFVYKYFTKINATHKDYQFIPKDMLEDPYFVFDCLDKNPDIYLLADKIQNMDFFNYLKTKHPNDYLKYASEEMLANREFCLKVISENCYNYPYLPKELKEDKNLIRNVFEKLSYGTKLSSSIPKKVLKDNEFVRSLLSKNPEIFFGIHKHVEPSEDLYIMLAFKNSDTFQYFDKSFKNNKDFVDKIFEIKELKEKNYDYNYTRSFSARTILEYVDISLFTSDFCKKHAETLINDYRHFSKEIKSKKELIEILFDNGIPLKRGVQEETIEGYFIRSIPIKEIVTELKEVSYNGSTEGLRDRYKIIVDKYYLSKELGENNKNITQKENKFKL